MSSVEVIRVDKSSFQLTVALEYTGGGDITHFTVSFRSIGTTEWIPLGDVEAAKSGPQSNLEWNGIATIGISNAESGQVEFQVSVQNEAMFRSETVTAVEKLSKLCQHYMYL